MAALGLIVVSHFLIDRFRLARYVCWLKNQAAPRKERYDLTTAHGYPEGTPDWLAYWLLFIVDNLMHVACNAAAIGVLG